MWYPNEKDAPRWQLDVRLDVGPVPDSDIPDAQRLNTVYDFVLPGGQNLVEAVAANSVHLDQKNFCVTILETPLPYNEAKRYNPKKEVCRIPVIKPPLRCGTNIHLRRMRVTGAAAAYSKENA